MSVTKANPLHFTSADAAAAGGIVSRNVIANEIAWCGSASGMLLRLSSKNSDNNNADILIWKVTSDGSPVIRIHPGRGAQYPHGIVLETLGGGDLFIFC